MRLKNLLIIGLVTVSLIGGLDLWMRPNERNFSKDAYDPFTDPKVIGMQEYMHTEHACGLISLTPMGPGHCLIIPKRKVARFEQLSNEELIEMAYIARKTHEAVQKQLGACGYILLQKNGTNVGQSVAHVHWHYVPRPVEYRSVLKFALQFINPFHFSLSIDEMGQRVVDMKNAIAALPTEVAPSKASSSSSSKQAALQPLVVQEVPSASGLGLEDTEPGDFELVEDEATHSLLEDSDVHTQSAFEKIKREVNELLEEPIFESPLESTSRP